jgi:exopolysaccharide biosynthesis polyprenyl glycosylphosphotransferase
MAITLQSVWRWLQFAEMTKIDRIAQHGFSCDNLLGNGLPPRKVNGKSNGRPHSAHSGSVLSGRWIQVSYALIDLLLICVNGLIAFLFRFSPNTSDAISRWSRFGSEQGFHIERYIAFLLLYALLILLFCQVQNLYRTVRSRTALQESFAITKAIVMATLLLTAFIYFSGVRVVSRLVVGYAGLLNVTTFVAWRLLKRRIVLQRAQKGIGTRNVLIIGAGRVGQALAQYLEQNKQLGLSFKGFLDANHSMDPKLLGKISDLYRVSRAEFIDEVLITIPSEREVVKNIVSEARLHGLDVKVVPDLYDGIGLDAPITHIGNFPVMELHWKPIPAFGLVIKRLFDIVGSGVGLILLSPILGLTGLAIRLDSVGTVIYRSQRMGRKGRRFTCYKFRTMVADADALKDQLRHLNERNGPTFKISKDPRITRVGMVLRKYSLDELPQLWNVLKGDMSLVGPRPHPLDDCDQYVLEHLRRLEVKPGITGLWQVVARRHPSFDTNMQLDLEYIDNWNLWLDARILLKTIPAVVSGSGR